MTRNIILAVLIVGALIGGGFLFYKQFTKKASESVAPTSTTQEFVPIREDQISGYSKEKTYHQTVDIDSRSFFFHPDAFRVKRGEKVTINVHATGDHTFVIDALKINKKTPNGVTTKIEFTPQNEGAFRYYCDKPGHQEGGQVGTLIVD